MYPSGNAQGTWYFMSLNTGRRLHRRNWTVLPMGQEVLDRVDKLAKAEGRSKEIRILNFEWRPGEVLEEPVVHEVEPEGTDFTEKIDEEQDYTEQQLGLTSNENEIENDEFPVSHSTTEVEEQQNGKELESVLDGTESVLSQPVENEALSVDESSSVVEEDENIEVESMVQTIHCQ